MRATSKKLFKSHQTENTRCRRQAITTTHPTPAAWSRAPCWQVALTCHVLVMAQIQEKPQLPETTAAKAASPPAPPLAQIYFEGRDKSTGDATFERSRPFDSIHAHDVRTDATAPCMRAW